MKAILTLLSLVFSLQLFSQSSYTLDTENIDKVRTDDVTWIITILDTLSDEAELVISGDTLATTDTVLITIPNELGTSFVGYIAINLDTIAGYDAFAWQGDISIQEAACSDCDYAVIAVNELTVALNSSYAGTIKTDAFPVRGMRLRLLITQKATGTAITTGHMVLKPSSISDN